MALVFKGWVKFSLIEYPKKTSTVLYLPYCNFRCHYCYNKDLILNPEELKSYSEEEVLNFLDERKGWIEAVVITGGECTLHKELPEFLKKVKEKGFLGAIETNGTNPEMLEKMIKEGLLNFVRMDIKAPLDFESYRRVTQIDDKSLVEKVKKSIKILRNSEVDYEFVTTVVPTLHTKEDILKIAEQIKGAKKFVLNQFIPKFGTLDKKFESIEPYQPEFFEEVREEIKNNFEEVEIRL